MNGEEKGKKILSMGTYVSRTAVPPLSMGHAQVFGILVFWLLGIGTGRAKGSGTFGLWVVLARHGHASLSSQGGQKISSFRIILGQIPTK
jgi:hypothetical protein